MVAGKIAETGQDVYHIATVECGGRSNTREYPARVLPAADVMARLRTHELKGCRLYGETLFGNKLESFPGVNVDLGCPVSGTRPGERGPEVAPWPSPGTNTIPR